jgi:hypothetical protein
MQAFATSTLYGYDNPEGKMELLRDEEVFNPYTDEWLLPRHNLYTPEELGLHTAQVLRYLSDLTEQERLEEEQELLEEEIRGQKCLLCEELADLCTFCAKENKASAADHLKLRAKLAEIDKRLAAVQKFVQDALPVARAARDAAPAEADAAVAAGGAGAGAGIEHLLLPLPLQVHAAVAAPVWPLLPPGPELFSEPSSASAGWQALLPVASDGKLSEKDSIEALIDEILARPA